MQYWPFARWTARWDVGANETCNTACMQIPAAFRRVAWSAALAGLAVYVATLLLRPEGALWPWSDVWLANGVLLLLAALVWLQPAEDAAHRRVVRWFAIALTVYGAGNTLFYVQAQIGWQISPISVADIGYLGFYPAIFMALLSMQRATGKSLFRDSALLMDLIISAMGAATLATYFLTPVLAEKLAGESGGWVTYTVGLAYPLADVLLIGCIAAALAGSAAEQSPGLVWIVAGLVAFTVGDYIYAIRLIDNTYAPGELTDASWMIGCAIIAWAVERLQRPARAVALYPSWLIPFGGGLIALAVLYLSDLDDGHSVSRTVALVTLITALVRWAVSYRRLDHMSELRRQARTDDLTGLRNRRAFFAALEPMLESTRADARVGIALIDLDAFKAVNDTHGHAVGNDVLVRAAHAMRAVAGRHAQAYRLGGDEFAIIDPAPELVDAFAASEQLQRDLESHAPAHGHLPPLRVSVGVAYFPVDARTADALLHCADQRMYEMKALHGRGSGEPPAEPRHRTEPRG